MAAIHNPNALEQFFALPGTFIVPRLAISLDGPDKTGKTHYALMTPPAPVRVISNDPGTEVVAQKARKAGRDVKVMYVDMPDPDPSVTRASDVDKEDLERWRAGRNKVKDVCSLILQDKKVRTLVVDTGGKLWDLFLLAHFGKMKKITEVLREEPNSEFHKMLWDMYKGREELNMIFIHHVKKQYAPNGAGKAEWNGGWERQGWNRMGAFVDMSVRTGWDGNYKNYFSELDSTQSTRYGSHLCGKKWYGAESSFATLGFECFPETELTPEVWGL